MSDAEFGKYTAPVAGWFSPPPLSKPVRDPYEGMPASGPDGWPLLLPAATAPAARTVAATLAKFLLARISEDEQRQHGKNGDEDWHEFQCDIHRLHPETKVRYGCDCGVPARVLAECEAKRRVVDHLDLVIGTVRASASWHLENALRLLALPYAEHPEYRNEWRP